MDGLSSNQLALQLSVKGDIPPAFRGYFLLDGICIPELRANSVTGCIEETGRTVHIWHKARDMVELKLAMDYYRLAVLDASQGGSNYDRRRAPNLDTVSKYRPNKNSIHGQTVYQWNGVWPDNTQYDPHAHGADTCSWCTCPPKPAPTAPKVAVARYEMYLAYHMLPWMLSNATDERWLITQTELSRTHPLHVLEPPSVLRDAARAALEYTV